MTLHIEIFDEARWATAVGERFDDRLRESPALRICLPTGDTPRPLYREIAVHTDLTAATIFLLDEFMLSAGHAARCDAMIERDLLAVARHPPGRVHALNTLAVDATAECRRIEGLIADGGLDLTVLGLGANGHLGLNEPGSAIDSATRVVELAGTTTAAAARYGEDAAPRTGMTLGMQAIMESSEVWLLVTGAHKASILSRVVHGPIGPEVPASYLRSHTNARLFADRSAAAEL